jgi:hypothetical protein
LIVDIVLPLLEADVDRYLRLQRPTFERFYADLGRTTVIAREKERARIERAIQHLDGVAVIGEEALVPEIALAKWSRRRSLGPWYRQQLIKLAAVAEARTDFALVMDADVFAVRPVSDHDIVKSGRALRPRVSADTHPGWVAQAGIALRLPALEYAAGVTPSVLSRAAVLDLANYAITSVRPEGTVLRLAAFVPPARALLTSWRGRLLSVLPWTEYQLYDTFLVRTDRFDNYHFYSDDPVLLANAVWERRTFDDWSPANIEGHPTHYFSLVQGFLDISTNEVVSRVREFGLLS